MIEAVFRQGMPDPAIVDGPAILTAVDPAEAEALCKRIRPGSAVLEIGSAFGYSALTMASAGARVLTIDPHAGVNPNSQSILQEHIAAYGRGSQVYPVVGYSQDVLPLLLKAKARFDLVFVDGDHSEEVAYHDATKGWELLRRGGWLACHDYAQAAELEVQPALDKWRPYDELVRTLWLARKR